MLEKKLLFNNNNGSYENNNTEWQPASTYNHRHVGYYLKQAREGLNLTIEEVSDTIRVRKLYLEAIEEGHYEQLPGTAYAVGFVRIYANFLGLNSARVVEQFRAETGPHQGEVEFEFEQAAPPIENQAMPKNIIIIISLIIAIFALVAYLFLGRSRVETPITDTSDIPTANETQILSDNDISFQERESLSESAENFNDRGIVDENDLNLTLEGVDANNQEQTGILANTPSNVDNVEEQLITIEDLIEGTGGSTELLNNLDSDIQEQAVRYGVNVNNYALPGGRTLEGWRNLGFVTIASKPTDLSGAAAEQNQSTNNNDVYAENALVTDVLNNGTSNNIDQNINSIGIEPKLRILAKEDSYIYVFKQSDASELKVGRLLMGSSYVIPEGEDVLLTYTGNVVVVVDGKDEVPVSREPNQRSVLNYEKLKQQAESLNTQ